MVLLNIFARKEENELPAENQNPETDKDALSQDELQHNVKTFEETDKPHAALETPEGKNKGAETSAFRNQQKWYT